MTPLPKRKFSTMRTGKRKASRKYDVLSLAAKNGVVLRKKQPATK